MDKLKSSTEVAKIFKAHGIKATSVTRVDQLVDDGQLYVAEKLKRGTGTIYRFRDCDIEEYICAKTTSSRELLKLPFFEKIVEEVGPSIKSFFGDDPGLLISVMPGGFIFSIVLLSYLISEHHCDVKLIRMEPGINRWSHSLLDGKKVLLVDGIAMTRDTLKKLKRLLTERNDIKLKGVRIFVWGDFRGVADYCVYRVGHKSRMNSFRIDLIIDRM